MEEQKKCEICKERDAVIHVQQIMGNEIIDLHLCEVCAHEKGIISKNESIELSLSELLTGLLDANSPLTDKKNLDQCPNCGMTYQDFRKEGKVGCAECYNSFHEAIMSILSNITAAPRHRGKYPKKLLAYKKLLVDKEQLKEKLQRAIQEEDYETAADLRDRINELEKAAEEDHGEQ